LENGTMRDRSRQELLDVLRAVAVELFAAFYKESHGLKLQVDMGRDAEHGNIHSIKVQITEYEQL
jgi:hypothetical protein